MAVKVYYDGSGKSDDPGQRFLTLTGIVASENVWSGFEAAWGAMLQNNGVPYLHMRELRGFRGPLQGWDEKRYRRFITDAMNVLGQFIPGRLRAYSCSVTLADYRRARKTITLLKRKTVEALCVDYCVWGLQFTHKEFDVPRPISLYFDRGEKFFRHVERVWNSEEGKRAQQEERGWPYQVASITEAEMKRVYPLQAADLIAWHTNRHYASVSQIPMTSEEAIYQTFFLFNERTWYFDYDGLKKTYAERGV